MERHHASSEVPSVNRKLIMLLHHDQHWLLNRFFRSSIVSEKAVADRWEGKPLSAIEASPPGDVATVAVDTDDSARVVSSGSDRGPAAVDILAETFPSTPP